MLRLPVQVPVASASPSFPSATGWAPNLIEKPGFRRVAGGRPQAKPRLRLSLGWPKTHMATQVASPPIGPAAHHAGPSPSSTARRAAPWWLLPGTVVTVLTAFSGYAIWTAFFAGGVNQAGPYLSPFYSPLFWTSGPVSPALWVLWSPLLFRATCYYYRKAYYRSFFWDPPACTLGELRHRDYRGEAKFPLFLNNLHRFFLYAVIVVTGFLWYDVFLAFFQ